MPWRAHILHAHVGASGESRESLERIVRDSGRELHFVDGEELEDALPEIEVLVCGLPPRVSWARARRLRLLHFLGAGVETLWPAEGLGRDVVIANARGIHSDAMRDHALAMILSLTRDLPRILRAQAERRWETFVAPSVDGATACVVGLGEVGRPIAAGCRALGMRVLGVRARPAPTPGVDEVFGPELLDVALSRADVVVIAAPLTSKTRHLFDATRLARMRCDALLVVLSRGGIVDEGALAAALAEGRLGGAAVDVFQEEPLSDASPLWAAPNTIVSAHVSGWIPHYVERAAGLLVENVARLEAGLPVLTLVDRAREY